MQDILAKIQEAIEIKSAIIKQEHLLWQNLLEAVKTYSKSERDQRLASKRAANILEPGNHLQAEPAFHLYDSPNRILRLRDVLQVTGLSRSSIYSLIKQGSFPANVSLGIKSVGWKKSEIDNWLQQRVSETGSINRRKR